MNFLEIDFKMKRKVCAYRKKQKYICLNPLNKYLVREKIPFCIPCIKDDCLLYEKYFKKLEKIDEEIKVNNFYMDYGTD